MEYIVKINGAGEKTTLDIYQSYNGRPTRRVVSLKYAWKIVEALVHTVAPFSKTSEVEYDEEGEVHEI